MSDNPEALPELPEPEGFLEIGTDQGGYYRSEAGYTADQVRAYARAALAQQAATPTGDEREAFEKAMAAEGYELNPQRYRDGTYRESYYAAGWAMWQARGALVQQAVAPSGDPAMPVVAWEYDDPECGFPGMPCTRFDDVPPGRALNSKPLVRKTDADAAIAVARQAATPAPVEPTARAVEWGRLYDRASRLCAAIGYRGELGADSDEVALVMDALHELDGGQHCPGLMPVIAAALPATPAAQQASQAKPTKAMLEAGMQAFIAAGGESVTNAQVALMFRAMLAATPAAQPAEERYTLDEIADACCYADVSDSRYESIAIALREYRRRAALKGNA